MQLGVVVGELLQLQDNGLLGLLGLDQIALCAGLDLGLLDDVLALGFDGGVGLLDEVLVGLLRVLLGADRLGLHGLRIADDLLDELDDTSAAGVVLVGLEAGRRRGSSWLLPLQQRGSLLVVEVAEHLQRSLQELLGLPLVGDHGLEVLVLELSVLSGALELHLHLGNLALQCLDGVRELLDGHGQVLNLGGQVLLLAVLLLGLELVLVELVSAEILVLDLVILLLQELGDHVVDGFLDASESIQLHLVGEGGQVRVVGLLGRISEHLRGRSASVGIGRAAGQLQQRGVEGPGEEVVSIVAAENSEGLRDSLHFQLAGLLALLPLLVGHLALFLEHAQELLVGRQRGLGIVGVNLGLGVLLVGVGQLTSLGADLVLAGLDLGLLGCLELLVGGLVGLLLLLGGRQVALEGVQHLPEDAEDLA
mmetsp:Transcript_78753/g.172692  ORF Transcript_78753/g.172692 Transcript_78753/m.172692 type:complete len:422 (+) Transcript_78753:254-1519(+)